jgi:hypothetical protein
VKVLYCEDLANHTSPESCGGDGNMAASGCNVDRGKRRRDIELRNHSLSGADPVPVWGRQY